MFDWVPLELYTPIYYYLLLVITLLVLFDAISHRRPSGNQFQFIGVVFLIFTLIYMGFRPINGRYFGDTVNYAKAFESYISGAPITTTKDVLFHKLMKACSYVMGVHFFFFICVGLYVVPLYIACKKWFKELWFLGFMFIITAFSYWAYGVNGVRNGIAGSVFILAISREKRIYQLLWIVLAIAFHKSMLLPTVGFVLTNIYNKPKKFIMFWVLCIPLSLVAGGTFETLFGNLGFDDRLSYFTEGDLYDSGFSSTGFRWDFLLYSATAVFAGWYYIVKKKYQDKVYYWLFNTYIFANAFWILVIRANFSNRFAYLSWFMIGLVIVYPLLKQNLLFNQYKKIGIILFLQFIFAFIMNVII